MRDLLEELGASQIEIILIIGIVLLFIAYILSILKYSKLNKRYNTFMSKFSNTGNIDAMLKEYLERVQDIKDENLNIREYCKKLERNIEKCIQKVGIVRYNAFADTGSDLCFALALLDFEDNGIIINGIYSRDNSTTTYAKPIKNGKSTYVLSKEEEGAIEKAKNSSDKYFINIKNN